MDQYQERPVDSLSWPNASLRSGNTNNTSGNSSRSFQQSNSMGELGKKDDAGAQKAMEEGRRLYVGNMPYQATTADVEELFASSQYTIERIDMSIDPFTGRNPSYCFVELCTSNQAKAAMEQLNGRDLLGRPVKIKPGVAKSSNTRQSYNKSPYKRTDAPTNTPYVYDRWHRTDAPHDFGVADQVKRLYIGGLPRMPDQATVNLKMKELFADWELDAVSKIISPHESKKKLPGNHYYLFVDFKDALEAADAARKLNGTYMFGGRLTIDFARGNSRKLGERREG